jgi:hypothetical protein
MNDLEDLVINPLVEITISDTVAPFMLICPISYRPTGGIGLIAISASSTLD